MKKKIWTYKLKLNTIVKCIIYIYIYIYIVSRSTVVGVDSNAPFSRVTTVCNSFLSITPLTLDPNLKILIVKHGNIEYYFFEFCCDSILVKHFGEGINGCHSRNANVSNKLRTSVSDHKI